jgi:hypothetical protein
LLILIIASGFILFSCGDGKDADLSDGNGSGGARQNGAEDGEEDEYNPLFESPVPQGVTFGGRAVRVLAYSEGHVFGIEFETASGDTENEALFLRNRIVEEKLGVRFVFTVEDEGANGNERLVRSVSAGMDEYDFIRGHQWEVVLLTTENIFMDLSGLPYLDIDQPWWSREYIEEAQIGKDRLFFVAGDWNIGMLDSAGAMFVSKQLYENEIGDPDDIYRVVLNGEWTFDYFSELVRGMYKDLSGTARPTLDDQFGVVVIIPTLVHQFTWGAGIRLTYRDEQGLPVMNIPTERNANWIRELNDLYFRNAGSFWIDTFTHSGSAFDTMRDMFSENRMLIFPNRLSSARGLRQMDDDFMIIPYPKFDAHSNRYYALPNDGALLAAAQSSTLPDALIGAVLEELAYQGWKHITPAFFDIALKAKYMRDSDDLSMRVIDIIRESITTDFAYVYLNNLEGGGTIFDSMLRLRSNRLVSTYAGIEGAVEGAMQALIDAYLE